MPSIPKTVTLDATSTQIINAIRKDLGGFYQSVVPIADGTTENLRQIGTAIMGDASLQNAFLSALVNRIGRVILTSKTYNNPWARFKKGMLEYGETVEEIFVNIAKPHQFDVEKSEQEVFKREIPDVRSAFHPMNYQKFYKHTVQEPELRQAFLSGSGITDLIGKIIEALYTAANYDEFLVMKYMIGRMALAGRIVSKNIGALSKENMHDYATEFKAISTDMTYLKSKYNYSKVMNHTPKSDQYLMMDARLEAMMDINVLATAFNMDKAEFMGHNIGVDSFSDFDNDRLKELFADDPNFVPFTEEELEQLATIQALLVDKDWFMIFDNYQNMTEQYNGQGMYWNYWYHVWKTFSVSPFNNAVMFVSQESTVTGVTVSPDSASMKSGSSLQMMATVEGTGFFDKNVTWKAVKGSGTVNSVSISPDGLLVATGDSSATITVTATSVQDGSQSGQATITLS